MIQMSHEVCNVIAKNDVRILRVDNCFTNFKKGNSYRCVIRQNDAVLMDEDKNGFLCDMELFQDNFERKYGD